MRTSVVLILSLLLIAAQSVTAADLQAGSYVQVQSFLKYYEGSFDPIGAGPSCIPGTYGPFTVSSTLWWDWIASVPTSANVSTGTAAYGIESSAGNYNVTRVTFNYQTDYSASQMRLELVTMDRQADPTNVSVIWSQNLSGYQAGSYDSGWGEYVRTADQYLGFRVVAVPEPSALLALLFPTLTLLGMRMRWRR